MPADGTAAIDARPGSISLAERGRSCSERARLAGPGARNSGLTTFTISTISTPLTAASRRSWHEALMERWIDENPPGTDIGWDPYPVSRRIGELDKVVARRESAESEGAPKPRGASSLAGPAIETHLQGNHLFANAKALVHAGLYFEGAGGGALAAPRPVLDADARSPSRCWRTAGISSAAPCTTPHSSRTCSIR